MVMRTKTWLALLVLAATVAIVGAVVLGVGHSRNDPRAYAVDSEEITLDESLQRSGIQLPECVRDDLRYALINDGFNYHYILYMKIETDEACASLFLGANKMQGLGGITKMGGASAEKPLSYRALWMSNKVISDMGWEIGPMPRSLF